MTLWLLVACWISTATRERTHGHVQASGHLHPHAHRKICKKPLIAFPPQKWFRERASVLRYTYIACVFIAKFVLWMFLGRTVLFRKNKHLRGVPSLSSD